jgi:hypothetical protein
MLTGVANFTSDASRLRIVGRELVLVREHFVVFRYREELALRYHSEARCRIGRNFGKLFSLKNQGIFARRLRQTI